MGKYHSSPQVYKDNELKLIDNRWMIYQLNDKYWHTIESLDIDEVTYYSKEDKSYIKIPIIENEPIFVKKNIEIKKAISEFRKDARIKKCFHFDESSCSNKIISAHSLQKSTVLSLLESNVDGNSAIYSFLYLKYNEIGQIIGLEPLGKKTASTFNGFCGKHDTILFQEIENNPVDISNDKHCFLLSYRSFAKDYHAKEETLQGFLNNKIYNKPEMIHQRNPFIYNFTHYYYYKLCYLL